jgi:hypothetical protein
MLILALNLIFELSMRSSLNGRTQTSEIFSGRGDHG